MGKKRVNKGRKKHLRRNKQQHRRKVDVLKEYAAQNRRRLTKAERVAAADLRSCGIEFHSQCVFEPYIVDFYLPKHGLVIEIDGAYHHATLDQIERDCRRSDNLLRRRAIKRIVRFSNEEACRGAVQGFAMEALRKVLPDDVAKEVLGD